jgi:hypothetical protein
VSHDAVPDILRSPRCNREYVAAMGAAPTRVIVMQPGETRDF